MEGKHACDRCKANSGRRIVSLIPGFINLDECGPLPRQFRRVRAEDGVCDCSGDDGPLKAWHRFARGQEVRGESAVRFFFAVGRYPCSLTVGGVGASPPARNAGATTTALRY